MVALAISTGLLRKESNLTKIGALMIATTLGLYGEALIRLAFPESCALCRDLLEIDQKAACPLCKAAIWRLRLSPAKFRLNHSLNSIRNAWALFSYQEPLKDLIASVKIMKKRWLLQLFFEEIRDFANEELQENPYDAIVPIPLDRRSLLEREFNQAEILAAEISRTLGIPMKSVLDKHPLSVKQSRLTKKERQINLRGAFYLKSGKNITDLRLLLVDDVMTTGSTAQEAARTLKQAGAKKVDVWALAYTPPPGSSQASRP